MSVIDAKHIQREMLGYLDSLVDMVGELNDTIDALLLEVSRLETKLEAKEF